VAARPLPAGRVLSVGDLAVRRWPASLAPAGAPAAVSAVVGRRLAGAVVAGDVITAPRLLGRDLTTGLPAGSVAAAVSLPDPHVGDLVRPGDRVDVLSAPAASTDGALTHPATVVAAGVRVLAVLADPDASADGPGTELIIAAGRDVATHLVRTASGAVLTVIGDSP
jgi:pilus assembly protein CpaB